MFFFRDLLQKDGHPVSTESFKRGKYVSKIKRTTEYFNKLIIPLFYLLLKYVSLRDSRLFVLFLISFVCMVIFYLHQKYQKILHFIFMLRLLYFSMSNDYESLGVGLYGRKSELVSDVVVFNNMFRFINESKCLYNPQTFPYF